MLVMRIRFVAGGCNPPSGLRNGSSNLSASTEINKLEDNLSEKITEGQEIIVRAKWTIDGATTLKEAAQQSRDFADYLENLEQEGYQFYQPVDSDYGFATPGGVEPVYDEDDEDFDESDFDAANDDVESGQTVSADEFFESIDLK